MTAYLTSLATTTTPEQFTEAALPLVRRDSYDSFSNKVYATKIGTRGVQDLSWTSKIGVRGVQDLSWQGVQDLSWTSNKLNTAIQKHSTNRLLPKS